jgi:hypothetical protein
MSRSTTRRAAATISALALTAGVLATAAPAHAAPDEVTGGLVAPLSTAVAGNGTVYVSQNFAGILTKVSTGGKKTDIYTARPGTEVGAVSVSRGVVTFATTGSNPKRPSAKVHILDASGRHLLANVQRYEKRRNPDGDRKYGIVGLSRTCKQKLPRGIRPYKGIVESHPYATYVKGSTTYLADAAANAILRIGKAGRIRTVAVLPYVKVDVTRKLARQFGLPQCAARGTMRFEPVPTDVEMGPDGMLYVSTLPGGPEDGSLGALGAVHRIDPATGERTKVAGELMSPVGVAVAASGDLYVSQLFAGSIAKITSSGERSEFAKVDFPGDVEVKDNHLYATVTDLTNQDGPPNGQVLKWSLTTAQ